MKPVSVDQMDLFGQALEAVPAPAKLPRQPVPRPSSGWQLADHACRHCFGRVLQRKVRGRVVAVRCAECGAHEEGDHTAICCCGAAIGALGKLLECFRNPAVSKAVPQEILIRERNSEKSKSRAQSKPVNVREY